MARRGTPVGSWCWGRWWSSVRGVCLETPIKPSTTGSAGGPPANAPGARNHGGWGGRGYTSPLLLLQPWSLFSFSPLNGSPAPDSWRPAVFLGPFTGHRMFGGVWTGQPVFLPVESSTQCLRRVEWRSRSACPNRPHRRLPSCIGSGGCTFFGWVGQGAGRMDGLHTTEPDMPQNWNGRAEDLLYHSVPGFVYHAMENRHVHTTRQT